MYVPYRSCNLYAFEMSTLKKKSNTPFPYNGKQWSMTSRVLKVDKALLLHYETTYETNDDTYEIKN